MALILLKISINIYYFVIYRINPFFSLVKILFININELIFYIKIL